METRVISLKSDGLNLAGHVYFPSGNGARPALCICHGIPKAQYEPGDNHYAQMAQKFCEAGSVTLTFNFRGCGQSQGNFDITGWANDLRSALDYLAGLDEVDRSKICLLGSSGGAAVAVCVAAGDPRVSCLVLLACPADFDAVLMPGHAQPFADHLRKIGLIREACFPASVEEWVAGFRKVRPLDCIGKIAPRPMLLMHGDADDTVPVEHARRLFEKAGEPKDLVIKAGWKHQLRVEEDVVNAVIAWLRARTGAGRR